MALNVSLRKYIPEQNYANLETAIFDPMNIPLVIIFIGVLIFSAHFFNWLFKFTKIPNVLLLLAIGILLGPVFEIVEPWHFGAVGPIFTTVTLVLLLFESGTSLKINELAKSIGSAFFLTLFNFIASAAIATGVAYLCTDLEIVTASFFGIIVAGTSSAVVIPMIQQLKMNQKGSTVLLLESALSDVLCLVIGLALLAAMKQGVVEMSVIWTKIWKSFLLASLIGVGGGILWSALISKMRILKNSIFTNLAFVFIVYGITEYFGFNGGIATLLFGIVLGNSEQLAKKSWLKSIYGNAQLLEIEKRFFAELVFILSTFFFVYVGANIKFGSPLVYVYALLIVIGITAIRPLSVKLFVRSKMAVKDLSIMSIMAPKGLVPAILASIPVQLGLAGGVIVQDLAYSVVLVSIIICAILVIILSQNSKNISFIHNVVYKGSTEHDTELHPPETPEGEIAEGEVAPVGENVDSGEESKEETAN